MHDKIIEEAKTPTITDPVLNDLMQQIGLSYAVEMPEFKDLMAAIDAMMVNVEVGFTPKADRLIKAKEKLLARVVK